MVARKATEVAAKPKDSDVTSTHVLAVCRWTVNRLDVDLLLAAGGDPAAL
jgi:hypothetical protein